MLPFKKDFKLVRSLAQKKFRRELNLFTVEGKKMVEEALHSPFEVYALYSTDESWIAQNGGLLVNQREMEQMTALANASSHLAVLRLKPVNESKITDEFIIALDGISDPGNFGTIIRTADWFGCKTIVVSEDTVELYNPKTIQSTMGSIYRMNVRYTSIADFLSEKRDEGYAIAGADLAGEDILKNDFPAGKVVLVIGSEAHGIRKNVAELLTNRLFIPGNGKAESLNAAVAAAILLSRKYQVGF